MHNAFLRIIKKFSKFQNTPAKDLAPLEDWDGRAEPSEAVSDYHALVDNFTRLPQTYRAVMEMKLLLDYSDGGRSPPSWA